MISVPYNRIWGNGFVNIVGILPFLGVSVSAIMVGDSPIWIAILVTIAAASYTTKRGRRTGAELSHMPFIGGALGGCVVLVYVAVWDWPMLIWMGVLVGVSYVVHILPKNHSPPGPLARSPGVGLLIITAIWPWVGSVELAVISGVMAFCFRYLHRAYIKPLAPP